MTLAAIFFLWGMALNGSNPWLCAAGIAIVVLERLERAYWDSTGERRDMILDAVNDASVFWRS